MYEFWVTEVLFGLGYTNDAMQFLNEISAEGEWEFVACDPTGRFIFRRLKSESKVDKNALYVWVYGDDGIRNRVIDGDAALRPWLDDGEMDRVVCNLIKMYPDAIYYLDTLN